MIIEISEEQISRIRKCYNSNHEVINDMQANPQDYDFSVTSVDELSESGYENGMLFILNTLNIRSLI